MTRFPPSALLRRPNRRRPARYVRPCPQPYRHVRRLPRANDMYYPRILSQLLDIKHHVVKSGISNDLASRYSLNNMLKSNVVYDIFSEEEYQLIKYLYSTAQIYNEIPEER